jgi:hypothetical protein
VGGIVGLSTVGAPAETMKHGYIGQLYEVTGLELSAASQSVNETATVQLACSRIRAYTVWISKGNQIEEPGSKMSQKTEALPLLANPFVVFLRRHIASRLAVGITRMG